MAVEIAAFIEDYRRALVAGDVDAMVAAYRLPLPVVRPDRTVMVTEASRLRGEIAKIIDTYRWAGMKSVAIAHFRTDGFDPGMHVVSLAWRPLNAKGEEIATIDVTYAIRRTLGGARIAAVIAHNEERRRDPLVRAWYAGLSGDVASVLRSKNR